MSNQYINDFLLTVGAMLTVFVIVLIIFVNRKDTPPDYSFLRGLSIPGTLLAISVFIVVSIMVGQCIGYILGFIIGGFLVVIAGRPVNEGGPWIWEKRNDNSINQ